MISSIPCGDFELNIIHPLGMPTLVPSASLKRHLDWRLHPASVKALHGEQTPTAEKDSNLPPLALHLQVHYL